MKRQQPESGDPVHAVDAVPNIDIDKLPEVDGLTALAASFRFMDNNPGMRTQIDAIISARASDVLRELEKDPETETFLVSERNVYAILAKATHETLGLVALGLGNAAAEAAVLERQFDTTQTEQTITSVRATELEDGKIA